MRRKIKKPFKLLILLATILFFKNCIAQKNNNKSYIISYGANLVFEDKNQFVNYINNEEILWNISPITFGVEKRLNSTIGIVGYIGSNLYLSTK